MIKEFTTSNGKFIAVENPNGAFKQDTEKIEVIGFTNQLSEKQWAYIVEKARDNKLPYGIVFRDYDKLIGHVYTATESGQSLMDSIGLPIVNPLDEAAEKEIKNYLILKVKG